MGIGGGTAISSHLFLFGRLFRQSDYQTHNGMETPRRQEALAYNGIPRWSLITIVIPILHTHMQLALGQDMSNSPIPLIALLVHIRLGVLFK